MKTPWYISIFPPFFFIFFIFFLPPRRQKARVGSSRGTLHGNLCCECAQGAPKTGPGGEVKNTRRLGPDAGDDPSRHPGQYNNDEESEDSPVAFIKYVCEGQQDPCKKKL